MPPQWTRRRVAAIPLFGVHERRCDDDFEGMEFTDMFWGDMAKFGVAAGVLIIVLARLLMRG
jgi:hypothetical protein